eukprot:scaffold3549_cov110-Skeletonema_dohrnii-CCMP3373.AAC.1
MDNQRNIEYYDSHVWDVKLENITSDEYNAEILRKLRDNDPAFTMIFLTLQFDDEDDFVINDDDDMGWLGYFIGRNTKLQELYIIGDFLDTPGGESDHSHSRIDALTQGISLNKSIEKLEISTESGDLFLHRLGNFFRNNKNLMHLLLSDFNVGPESARNLAVMLRVMSLEYFHLEGLCYDVDSDDFIDDDGVSAEVMSALSKHTRLDSLHLCASKVNQKGCTAIGGLSSLKELSLRCNDIDDEGMNSLVGNMSSLSNLMHLMIVGNNFITVSGIMTLSTFLQSKCRGLLHLELSNMGIDNHKAAALSSGLAGLRSLKYLGLRNSICDDALRNLVAAVTNKSTLEVLNLSENDSITAKGLSSLSILFQSERCCLRELNLCDMHIGDDGAEALAKGLVGNKSLKCLKFHDSFLTSARVGISTTGWSAFTRLVCDTSSINNTYLSNHTLERICGYNLEDGISPPDVEHLLALNRRQDEAPLCKILMNHPDLDMKLLFRWKLKFLPLIIAWLERARHSYVGDSSKRFHCRGRELSAAYQFIHGLPSLAVAGYRGQNMTDTQSKKRKFDHL